MAIKHRGVGLRGGRPERYASEANGFRALVRDGDAPHQHQVVALEAREIVDVVVGGGLARLLAALADPPN